MHNFAEVKINNVLSFVLAMHKYKLIFPQIIVYITFKRQIHAMAEIVPHSVTSTLQNTQIVE